jgi:hypothetical protein
MNQGHRLPFLLALVLLGAAITATGNNGDPVQLDGAAVSYDSGQYEQAYDAYLKLAKDGSPLAQYRVSYMLAMGLGTREDVIESLAWAVVASKTVEGPLDAYRNAVAALIPGKERKKALKKADYYLRRWGNEDTSRAGGTLARSSEGGCTGSRLAGNCGASAGGGSYWISWPEDRSSDPEQKQVIQDMDKTVFATLAG